jgi:hypothetical protein
LPPAWLLCAPASILPFWLLSLFPRFRCSIPACPPFNTLFCCVPPRHLVLHVSVQFMESLIRAFPLIEVSIRTSSRKLRSVLDVFYQAVKTGAAPGSILK